MAAPLKANMDLQFFFASQNFQEETSVHVKMRKGEKIARVNIPLAEYSSVRADFGNISECSHFKGTIGYSKQQQQWYDVNYGYQAILVMAIRFIAPYRKSLNGFRLGALIHIKHMESSPILFCLTNDSLFCSHASY